MTILEMKHRLFMIITLLASSAAGATSAAQSDSGSWPVKWCQAQPGMSKEQLVSVMGQPTRAFPDAMMWWDHHYQFNAFLNPDGTVKQLDINVAALTEAEKSALQCQTIRTQRAMAAAPVIKPPANNRPACEIISPAEMSAILGAPVLAHDSGRSKCIFKSSAGAIGPTVEFSVDRGDGAAAMQGAGIAGRHEPGLTSRYDGIGDQAVAAGPALLIRTGDDLVTLVFFGVEDVPRAAKKIFDTAKPRL